MTIHNTLGQIDLIDIFHPKGAEYAFFSNAHGTFFKIDHMLRHTLSFYKFKGIEIISSIFKDHNHMRLEISYSRNTAKKSNSWTPSSMLLNNEWVTNETKEGIKSFLAEKENEHTKHPHVWDPEKAVLRMQFEVLQTYLKKQEKFLPNFLTLQLKDLEGEQKEIKGPEEVKGRK